MFSEEVSLLAEAEEKIPVTKTRRKGGSSCLLHRAILSPGWGLP